MSVGQVIERKDQPAYIRFEKRPIEDRQASEREGFYRAKDVDFVLVTPPYSRDVFEQEAHAWLAQMRVEAERGRLPREWFERYEKQYELWKRGEEMPLDGTAIKGWPVISPAQQETLIRLNIRTVEALAGMNDEGIRRVGIGAIDLRNKANAWLSQARDKGPLTIENANLKAENAALKVQLEDSNKKLAAMAERLGTMQRSVGAGFSDSAPVTQDVTSDISAADIMDEPVHQVQEPQPQQPKRRGRPPQNKETTEAPI